LFVASASGTTRFRIQNTGELVLGDNGSTNFGTLDLATLTTNRTYTLPDEAGILCIQGSSNCGFAVGANPWNTANGTIYPKITTQDLLLGGIATTSAKFAVLNMKASLIYISQHKDNNYKTKYKY
jgi:hypothetical protein